MRTIDPVGSVELLGKLSSVSIARAYVRMVLWQAGRCEVNDVELLAGELVANAVKYSESGRRLGGAVRLRVFDDGETVRVEVVDEGSAESAPRDPVPVDLLSESGRGLWLVRELSSAWGWEQAGTHRTVWFEIRW
ncbi:ATP-binding protein [Sphaerisporangium sp. B11E5]|uniref:ATP-binding protein n=1 Tax=Sphaerisporangium sp. B11E5 TaxID=3153563 RepID=UPI00325D26A0